MCRLWPSIQPSWRKRCSNGATNSLQAECLVAPRKPMVACRCQPCCLTYPPVAMVCPVIGSARSRNARNNNNRVCLVEQLVKVLRDACVANPLPAVVQSRRENSKAASETCVYATLPSRNRCLKTRAVLAADRHLPSLQVGATA